LVEPGIQDSAKDLINALKAKKFLISSSPEGADLVVTVVNRFTGSQIIGSQTGINRMIFGGLYATNRGLCLCHRMAQE
jgi:hypothetical protein